jgi:hypothetical protein
MLAFRNASIDNIDGEEVVGDNVKIPALQPT